MAISSVRLYSAALAALLSIATPSVFGMDSIGEEFGNHPIQANLPFRLLSVLNDTHRVYMYCVDSDGSDSYMAGYFRGDTAAIHDALRQYAALEKGLDVVLLPGPREVTSFDGKQKMSADWELYIPSPSEGLGARGRRPVVKMKPTLYLYVRIPDRPAAPATADQVARWLAALDAEEFEDRERASGELEKQGVAVIAALRKALEAKPPAESRRRIGLLLAKLEGLPGINLDVLAIPEGVRVLGPDDLLARHRKALKSDNVRTSDEVKTMVQRLGPDPAALAVLIEMLADKDKYRRGSAVDMLGRMGKAAAPALPTLRARLANASPDARAAIQGAITAIEAAKEEPDAAKRAEKAKAAREEIARLVKRREEKVKE